MADPVPPLRGLSLPFHIPTARAVGYVLSSLTGLAQMQIAIFVLWDRLSTFFPQARIGPTCE
jgi:hypothetical protein